MSTESEAQEAAEREARAEGGALLDRESGSSAGGAPPADLASDSAGDPEQGIQIPLTELSEAALHAIVEEFVTRDGTEHTEGERKVAQVMALLERGQAEVWFNEKTRTCNILRVD